MDLLSRVKNPSITSLISVDEIFNNYRIYFIQSLSNSFNNYGHGITINTDTSSSSSSAMIIVTNLQEYIDHVSNQPFYTLHSGIELLGK